MHRVTLLLALAAPPLACSGAGMGDVEPRGNDRKPMAFVPAGSFFQGSSTAEVVAALGTCRTLDEAGCQDGWFDDEKPTRRVMLDAFWIDLHEVTNDDFDRCVARGYCTTGRYAMCRRYDPEAGWTLYPEAELRQRFGPPRQPAVCVSWYDAAAYCRWAGKRLPSEAEWERAARGEDNRLYPWGDSPPTCGVAVFHAEAPGCGRGAPAPPGGRDLGRSPFGITDLAGNAMEWVHDGYDAGYYAGAPLRNPINEAGKGGTRAARGGSWAARAPYLRSANRGSFDPEHRSAYVGFRCAMDADPD